jgi:hypothetical protein
LRQTKWSEILRIIGPVIVIPILLFFIFHLTPSLAIRTFIFFNGHPIVAVTTKIVDNKELNPNDIEKFKKEHAKCYSLTKVPNEKDNDTDLLNYVVHKKGILYLAEYSGNA